MENILMRSQSYPRQAHMEAKIPNIKAFRAVTFSLIAYFPRHHETIPLPEPGCAFFVLHLLSYFFSMF